MKKYMTIRLVTIYNNGSKITATLLYTIKIFIPKLKQILIATNTPK